jgi:tetratricopeptide (TPR) repeat protein
MIKKILLAVSVHLLLLIYSEAAAQRTTPNQFEKGLGSYEKEDWEGALSNLNSWLQTHPSDSEAYWIRSQTFSKLKDLDRALSDLNILLTLSPERAEAYFERGRVRYLLMHYEDAISDFENYLKLPPGETTRILYKIGPGDSGVSGISTAQSGNPAQAYFHMGLCSIALAEYDFAILYLDEAISFDSDQPEFYTEKGRALTRIGDNVPAMESFEIALELDPDYLPAKQGLALVKNGGDEILLAQLDQVISDSTANSQTYKQRGFYRMNHQNESGAMEDFTLAIALEPEDSESFFYRGKLHTRQKNWRQAEADFSAALNLEPENPEYYLARGQARYQKGDLEPALADFTLTLTQDPEFASGLYHRGITLQRLGKITEACQDLLKGKNLGMREAEVVWEKVCGKN